MTQHAKMLHEMEGPLAVVPTAVANPAILPGDPLFDFVLVPVKHIQSEFPTGPSSDMDASTGGDGRLTVVKLDSHGKAQTAPNSETDRRLTAVLSVDAADYCRLMHADEAATLERLNGFKQLMMEEIRAHGGRVVDAPGDNLMATFVSIVAAVRCSVIVQRRLKKKNLGLPTNQRMDFRMGLHMGDVIYQGPCIYGDTVNIAARLQGMAEPGGIHITRAVYDQVKHILDLRYDDIGKREIRNLPDPIAIFRIGEQPPPSVVEDLSC